MFSKILRADHGGNRLPRHQDRAADVLRLLGHNMPPVGEVESR